MKKIILILVCVFTTMVCNAQWVQKQTSDEKQKAEWLNAQKQIKIGKTCFWTGAAIGAIDLGVTTYMITRNNSSGENIFHSGLNEDGTYKINIPMQEYNNIIRTIGIGVGIAAVGLSIYGLCAKANGMRMLNKIYFNGNGVTYVF